MYVVNNLNLNFIDVFFFFFLEVDLIFTFYVKVVKLLGLEKVELKGYKIIFKWNLCNLLNIKFKRFWKKYYGKLTFYFFG